MLSLLGKVPISRKGPNPFCFPCSIMSVTAVDRRRAACWTFLYHSYRNVPCWHVLGRAWRCTYGCFVPGVMRNCNSEQDREGKDKIWDGLSTWGQGIYPVCWFGFSLRKWFVMLGSRNTTFSESNSGSEQQNKTETSSSAEALGLGRNKSCGGKTELAKVLFWKHRWQISSWGTFWNYKVHFRSKEIKSVTCPKVHRESVLTKKAESTSAFCSPVYLVCGVFHLYSSKWFVYVDSHSPSTDDVIILSI